MNIYSHLIAITFRQSLLLWLVLGLLLVSLRTYSADCSAIFPDGLQNSNNGGNITFGFGSELQGNQSGGVLLSKKTINGVPGAGNTCNPLNCTNSGTIAASGAFQAYPGGANISIGFQQAANFTPGDYNNLNMSSEATLNLAPGDYSFKGSINISSKSAINVTSPGTVRIHFKRSVSLSAEVLVNSAAGDRYVFLYADAGMTVLSNAVVNAVVFSEATVTLNNQALVVGAITAKGNITLGSASTVIYDGSRVDDTDFGDFCTGTGGAKPDHYSITHGGNAATCEPATITVAAHAADHSAVAPSNTTEITLSTDISNDGWTLISGGGSWDNVNKYTFDGIETTVQFGLAKTSPATLNIDVVSSGGVTDIDGDASEDADITFADAAFKFIADGSADAIANQVSGTTSTQSLLLRAIQTDPNTGVCTSTLAGSVAVDMAYDCINPSSCALAQGALINSTAIDGNPSGVISNYEPVTLNFSGGEASFTTRYDDVGQIRLHAKADITVETGTAVISGASNPYVVKPYTLVVTNVPGNPATTSSGSGFVAAGSVFTVQVESRNALGNRTPNFGNESSPAGIDLQLNSIVYPSTGVIGSLTAATAFSAITPAGTLENTTLRWNEAGTITLRPELVGNDYLSAGDLVLKTPSGNVGRFYPDHFRLISSVLDNACVSGGFSYMSQPLALSYTLQAESADGNALLSNYDNTDTVNGWLNAALLTYQAEDSDSGVELNVGNRFQAASYEWVSGQVVMVDPTASFDRQAGLSPLDGPYVALDIGLEVTDSLDSRPLQALDMDADSAGNCAGSCTAKKLGNPLQAYFGRMRIKDAFGPETAAIPMFWQNEYWDGNRFVLNSNDSCTALPTAGITFAAASMLVDEPSNSIAVTLGGITSNFLFSNIVDNAGANEIIFNNGLAGFSYGAPIPASAVNYQMLVDLSSLVYLTDDWNLDSSYGDQTQHPAVFIQFNHYRGNDRVIYWREVLQ